MRISDYIQVIIFISALVLLAPLLGAFIAQVCEGQKTFLHPALSWLEKLTYKIGGVNPNEEMNWKEYTKSLLVFNLFGFIFVFLLQVFQSSFGLNPQSLPNINWHSALNTAVSFVTNTNWQGYAGEVTMSYFTQMLALTVQNFLSAATGIAVFIALVRGIKKSGKTLGNFWQDMTRSTVYILLPLSILLAVALVGQGVIQNFSSYAEATTIEGVKQIIPGGPAASQIAIKQLGTNGGGFFNVNSAHPFENPTAFSNFLQMLAIILIPAALALTYGRMVGSRKQGWTIFAVMFAVWFITLVGSIASEYMTNPTFQQAAIMEGKETRFGVVNSLIWSTVTTAASNGSVNTMHSSLSPLAGALAMFNMMMGEVIFGGVGTGMYGMILFVLLTVFLSGLMVGRSPEYLGKKIEAPEVKMALLGILAPCACILIFTAISAMIPAGLSSVSAKGGPHGFSEILYAFTSATANNGSAFAGLNANTPYYNVMLSIAMLVGRFIVILPVMAIAGQMLGKKVSPVSAGTFSTDNALFGFLLIGVIVIVGALTFLPALTLGPIVEHFLMINGQTF
ncbi:MAG: potassium-transporting ATPase subunit KdpA [Bdellovibrio sp.]|nr:potassium-transporting ATPase subunit KdpA [Bdellovibrio sp.]